MSVNSRLRICCSYALHAFHMIVMTFVQVDIRISLINGKPRWFILSVLIHSSYTVRILVLQSHNRKWCKVCTYIYNERMSISVLFPFRYERVIFFLRNVSVIFVLLRYRIFAILMMASLYSWLKVNVSWFCCIHKMNLR